jgi:hypothetical protein
MIATHAVMTRHAFNSLLEYSRSLPTGTTIGKRWRRNCGPHGWFMGEYVDDPYPSQVGIAWRQILIAEE